MAITTLETKICIRCKLDKPYNEYHKSKSYSCGKDPRCKKCRSELAKERNAKLTNEDRERLNETQRRWRKRNPIYRQRQYTNTRYNKSPEQIMAFVDAYTLLNGNVCASCGVVCDVVGGVKTKGNRRLVLDHDHKTGELRSMICDFCNTALGKLGDTSDGVEKLLRYIKRYE